MAQAGYTPISLYYSTTASAQPTSGNLVAGELALNTLDEKLYFKNSAGTVKLLASSASTTNVQTISFGTTGLTPSTATSGVVTVAGTLAVGNGGTGITSFGTGVAGALGQNVSGSGSIALTTSPVFTTPNLGTPSAVTLTNATGLPLSTGVTGTLAIGNGGTGQTTASAAFNALSPLTTLGDILYGGASGAGTRLGIGSTSQVLTVVGGIPAWSTPASGGVTTISFGSTGLTPSTATSGAVSVAGTLAIANGGTGSTSTTYCSLTSNVTGTLPVANGGTGSTTLTTNSVMLGNGTSALSSNMVAPGTTGNVLTSNGTTWTSAAAAGGGFTATQVFSTVGTTPFTVPTGKTTVLVQIYGAGGGGGNAPGPSVNYKGGAGSGGGGWKYVNGLVPGATITVTIGSGGAAGASGGSTSFGPYVSASGGSTSNTTAGGAAGNVTGADFSFPGTAGNDAYTYSVGPCGCTTIYIGGGGGTTPSYNITSVGSGGGGGGGNDRNNPYGSSGGASNTYQGGGGSAANGGPTSASGGAGGKGLIIVQY